MITLDAETQAVLQGLETVLQSVCHSGKCHLVRPRVREVGKNGLQSRRRGDLAPAAEQQRHLHRRQGRAATAGPVDRPHAGAERGFWLGFSRRASPSPTCRR